MNIAVYAFQKKQSAYETVYKTGGFLPNNLLYALFYKKQDTIMYGGTDMEPEYC